MMASHVPLNRPAILFLILTGINYFQSELIVPKNNKKAGGLSQ